MTRRKRLAIIVFSGGVLAMVLLWWRSKVMKSSYGESGSVQGTGWNFYYPVGQKVDHRSRKYPIRGVILHHTVTSSPSVTYKVFLQRGVSSHFEIGPDGRVWKYLEPETDVAYHVGQKGFNDRFIGVDLTGPPFTELQMQVLPKFLKYLSERYGFRLVFHQNWGFDSYAANNPDKVEGVYAHAQVQSNKIDPSTGTNNPIAWNNIAIALQQEGIAYA